MTAEEAEIETTTDTPAASLLDLDIEKIFEFLSLNEKIVFKSQQIDDPELERTEKVQIAREIFTRNRQTFLQRFGLYMEDEQLNAFEKMLITATWNEHESGVEIQDMIVEYRCRLKTRKRDVKNRRYTAMQELIKQGDYFSELEMMNRAPELYQELVGQYLSEEEIKERDTYDVKNTTFSGILMHTFEQRQRDEMLKEADAEIKKEALEDCDTKTVNNVVKITNKQQDFEVEEEDEDDDEYSNDESEKINTKNTSDNFIDEFEVPTACRQQWGNFDNDVVACSTSRVIAEVSESNSVNKSKPKQLTTNVFITGGERSLLRQEFIDLMYEKFLTGSDTNFDYTLVDDNTQLDDLSQINQDKEDAYFATSDDDEDAEEVNSQKKVLTETIADDTESEDELDLYMRHLNQHHSLKF